MALLYMCHPNGVNLNEPQRWDPGTPEFNAILGTDNGKAGAFMLIDHLDQMNKTISHIESSIQGAGGEIEIHFRDLE